MKFNKTLLTAAVLALGGFAAMSGANAATSDTFDISLTVESACNITTGSATDIDLGKADNTVKTGQNSIEVFCSKNLPYQLTLTPENGDTNGAGVLTGPGGEINYQLTKTDGGEVWGNVEDDNTLSAVGSGAFQANTHGVAVKTTSSTDLAIGTYTDTVTIGLSF